MNDSARAQLPRSAPVIEPTLQVVCVSVANTATGLTGRRGPQGRGSPLTAPEVAGSPT